jgi:hypothetical protein
MFLKHFLVVLTNHSGVFFQKIQFSVPQSQKNIPNQYFVRVLHHLDDVLALGPPDPFPPPPSLLTLLLEALVHLKVELPVCMTVA